MLIVESNADLPLVSFSVSLRVGAVHDPPGKAGLAQLASRMLRRGASSSDGTAFTYEQFEQRIDTLGAEVSTHTGLGVSSVGCELLKRSLAPTSELVASLLAQPTFSEQEFDRLKRQAQAELIDRRDDDAGLASRALRRHLFAGHPHTVRPAGNLKSLASIERDELVAFHRDHYNRSSAIVTVCGDISMAEAETLHDTLLAGLPDGPDAAQVTSDPQRPTGRHMVVVDKQERSQTQMVVGSIGVHPRETDYHPLHIANTAFGGAFSSRLMQEVRAKRGWSYGASSSLAMGRVRDAFTMWTAPAANDTADCLALQLELLGQLVRDGIDDDELEFCKDYLRRSYAFEIDTPKKRAGQRLEEVLLELPADYYAGYLDGIAAVTREQANDALQRHLSADNLWISLVASDPHIGDSVRNAAGTLVSTVVEPYDLE